MGAGFRQRHRRCPGLFRLATLVLALEALLARPFAGANLAAASPPQEEMDRVGVITFVGPNAEIVRSAAVAALVESASLEVPSTNLMEAEMGGSVSPWARAGELGRRLNLKALVFGHTERRHHIFTATLTILAGSDGAQLGRMTFSARTLMALHAQIRSQLWRRVRPLLAHASPRPAPQKEHQHLSEPEPVKPLPDRPWPPLPPSLPALPPPLPPGAPTTDDEVDAAAEGAAMDNTAAAVDAAASERPSPVATKASEPSPPHDCSLASLEVGGGPMLRAFNYHAEQRGPLRGYFLSHAPAGSAEGTLFPFARGCGPAGAFGFRAAYERMAPVDSKLADRALRTQAAAYQVELVGRISLGRWLLTPGAGYYVRSYEVDDDVVPAVNYRSLGGVLDAQARFGSVIFEMGAGARRIFDAGQLQTADWFPELTANTYLAKLRIGGAMTDWLDLMLGVHGEYTSFDFHIANGGVYPNGVAEGAHDIYLAALLSLRVHLAAPLSRGN